MLTNCKAALAYAAAGLPVFPMAVLGGRKRPLTTHGYRDASLDPAHIQARWAAAPGALVAIPTGGATGRVVLDIDVKNGVTGWDTLEELGVLPLPTTPHAHTPSGGCHVHFLAPAWSIRCSAGKIGPGLDIRAGGGSIILPAPVGGYWWDPFLSADAVPLAPLPDWLNAATRPPAERIEAKAPDYLLPGLSRYGRAALDGAGKDIMAAPAGQQETTLNRKAYWIGQLVAAGEIPRAIAKEALIFAASRMPDHDAHCRWQIAALTKKISDAVDAGSSRPANSRRMLHHA